MEDLPYLETSLSDQKLDLRILELGLSFVRFECKFQCKEIMRRGINFVMFNCQTNYQSQTPLLLST